MPFSATQQEMSSKRRKSLSLFRPNVSSLTPIRDVSNARDVPSKEPGTLKKKLRPISIFSSSPTNDTTTNNQSNGSLRHLQTNNKNHHHHHYHQPPSPLSAESIPESAPPQVRPRTLQKQNRPSSIFGSLRSLHSVQDEDESLIHRDGYSDGYEETGSILELEQMAVLHHGEVQMAGSMFRKRSQYLVLTNTHLLRFKNQVKAAEVFPEIPSSPGRASSIRHSRMSSGGSNPEGSLLNDPQSAIALHNVVAVYKLDDGRPYFTIELAHYDEASNHASTLNMQLNDPRDSELWLTSIRAALTKSRLTEQMPFTRRALEYCARFLEMDADYDPLHFRMFTVVQRATRTGSTSTSAGRSSTDDLGKLTSNIYYLVIGIHKVHLVPLPKIGKSSGSSTSLSDQAGGGIASYGLVCLCAVHVQTLDDAFQLAFRGPLQPPQSLYLASASASDVALCVRQAVEWLRPAWIEQPFSWSVPDNLDEALLPVPEPDEEYACFDRTLVAYCVAYKVDPSNIRYTVNFSCEDAPEFQLFEPANSRKGSYSSLELLATLRALRYNESFRSISFRGIRLDNLHGVYDRCGSEHFMWSTRSGGPVKLPRLDGTPLIVQEFQCLALKSTRLRRFDLTDVLSRKPRDVTLSRDPGSGFCEALFPLCLLSYTNVDWIILSGVALSVQDLEYIYAAAIKRVSHLRSVELARCGLDANMLKFCLEGLSHQTDTLETMVIASNPGMIPSNLLARNVAGLRHIRRLDLSRVPFETSPEPLLSLDQLTNWRLESLVLSGTTLNPQTIDAVSAYLLTEQSSTLREIRMEACQLNGQDVAKLLHSMQAERSSPRQLHFVISENRLERNHSRLVSAIEQSVTPTQMTIRMLEYSEGRNFAHLLDAVAHNKSLTYLDISRTSVPFDSSNNAVCNALRNMLETNTHLKELNISGEQAHLEAVTLGRGLPNALAGLESNTSLQILHIENQSLGLPGASALTTALEHNSALLELYCDDNEISLQAFTTLVNAVKINKSLLYLPSMERDRAWSRSKVDREVNSMLKNASNGHDSHQQQPESRASKVKKSLTQTGRSLSQRSGGSGGSKDSGGSSGSHHNGINNSNASIMPGFTQQDVQAAFDSLDMTWDMEIARLQGYLSRNYCLANGIPFDGSTPTGATNGGLSNGGGILPPGMGFSPVNSRPQTSGVMSVGSSNGGGGIGSGGASGGLMGALNRAAQQRTPTAELDRQLGNSNSNNNGNVSAAVLGAGAMGIGIVGITGASATASTSPAKKSQIPTQMHTLEQKEEYRKQSKLLERRRRDLGHGSDSDDFQGMALNTTGGTLGLEELVLSERRQKDEGFEEERESEDDISADGESPPLEVGRRLR